LTHWIDWRNSNEELGPLVRVRTTKPLRGYKVLVVFENESQREIDLEPYLHGPIFEPIRKNASMFRAMKIEGGTIAWIMVRISIQMFSITISSQLGWRMLKGFRAQSSSHHTGQPVTQADAD